MKATRGAAAGVPARDLQRVAEGLNQGGVSAVDFVAIMEGLPQAADTAEAAAGLGDFVVAQVGQGLRGEALAQSIQTRLRTLGIPAGGHRGPGPPPIARRAIPPFAQDRIGRGDDHDDDRGPPPGIGPGRARGRDGDRSEGRPGRDRRMDPAELGRLGGAIAQDPARAQELLQERGLDLADFAQRVRRVSEDPAGAASYRRGFERRASEHER